MRVKLDRLLTPLPPPNKYIKRRALEFGPYMENRNNNIFVHGKYHIFFIKMNYSKKTGIEKGVGLITNVILVSSYEENIQEKKLRFEMIKNFVFAELGTRYFLQMYLNTKYIDVFKCFLKYFFKYFFILFSKYHPYSFNPL